MTLTTYTDVLQGSDEWVELRRGLLTASTIGALITSKSPAATDYACPQCNADAGENCWSMAKKTPTPVKVPHGPRAAKAAENPDGLPDRIGLAGGEAVQTLVASIVAERLTDWEDPEYSNWDMERGHQVEPIARQWYSNHTGRDVEQVGFMVLELDGGHRLGFSPDGLIGDDGVLEVKAPRAKKHLLTHVSGEMPAEHMAQCQTGLYVSGRSFVDFISYVGGEAPFLKRIHADPTWFAAIERAVEHFEAMATEMADAYLAATNGIPKTDRLPDPYDLDLVNVS